METANSQLALAWKKAAEMAAGGAAKTADFVAKKGRAHNHGEASLGTPDPGATSFALLMGAVPEFL